MMSLAWRTVSMMLKIQQKAMAKPSTGRSGAASLAPMAPLSRSKSFRLKSGQVPAQAAAVEPDIVRAVAPDQDPADGGSVI